MLSRPLFIASLALLALLLANLSLADPPRNKNSRKRRNQSSAAAAKERQEEATLRAARAQKAAAEKVLAAAQSKASDAKEKLEATLKKLKEESDQFRDAQSTSRHLAKELAEVEQEILDEQTPTSDYAKASIVVETSRAALVKVEEKILSESQVQSQLAALTGVKLVEQQTSILNRRPDYIAAKTILENAAAKLSTIRDGLFQADSDWKEAAKALAQAKSEEAKAQADTRGPTSGRSTIAKTAKSAEEAIAQARAAIAQADRVIKSLESKKKNDPPPRKKDKKI